MTVVDVERHPLPHRLAPPRHPYLIRGLAIGLAQRTPAQMIAAAGHRIVPVQYSVRPVARLDPRVNAGNYLRTTLTLSDAVHALQHPPRPGVTHVLSGVEITRWLPELDHADLVPAGLDRRRCAGPYLFAGADGTGTALHYDPTDNYLQVVTGRKEVLLLPPGHLRQLGAPPAWQPYCGVSRLHPDTVEHLPGALRCCVERGDVLVVPRNWWHAVRNRGLTVAVSTSPHWSAWSVLRWRQGRVVGRLHFESWLSAHPRAAERIDGAVTRWGRRPLGP